jgi:hypothetical protein
MLSIRGYTRTMTAHRPTALTPGTVISIERPQGKTSQRHFGIVSSRVDQYNLPLIISASPQSGRIIEEVWPQFTNGQPATIHEFMGGGDPQQAVAFAQSQVGKEWRTFLNSPAMFPEWAYLRTATPPNTMLPMAVLGVALLTVIAGIFILAIKQTEEAEKTPDKKKQHRISGNNRPILL